MPATAARRMRHLQSPLSGHPAASADITAAAYLQIPAFVPDQALTRWAAHLAPVVAIEAITAWLDAGQPEPAWAAVRVRQAVTGVIGAAACDVDCHLPSPVRLEGPPS